MPEDPFEISNIVVNTSFDPGTYTWDAEVTFDTNIPATATVSCGPSMDCYSPCSYNYQEDEDGSYSMHHTVWINDLVPSTSYCCRIDAYGAPEPRLGCFPFETESFNLTNGYDEIYALQYFFKDDECRIKTSWKTKFPSASNKVYWREVGCLMWNYTDASQDDCEGDRTYTASFYVNEETEYEFKVSTTIDGVNYESGVINQYCGQCDSGSGQIPIEFSKENPGIPFLYAHPNPFNPSTTLSFNVPYDANVDMSVYSADGRIIKTLASGWHMKGIHRIRWSGRNDFGAEVTSGIYFVKLNVGGKVYTSKIILLR